MTKRNINADYIAEYRAEHDRAVTAGNTAHAERVAAILAGYGVTVETAAGTTPDETGDEKPSPSETGGAPETTEADPAHETATPAKPARKQPKRK